MWGGKNPEGGVGMESSVARNKPSSPWSLDLDEQGMIFPAVWGKEPQRGVGSPCWDTPHHAPHGYRYEEKYSQVLESAV